jgi:ubiquinone biosynthesis protein COQ4
MNTNRNPMQPVVAFKAMRRLIADPEQTHEVFTVIRALSGPALQNSYIRFADTEVGQRVLREEIELLDTLQDQESLAGLPGDTLGRHYLNFVTSQNISADGLVEASEDGEFQELEGGIKRFGMRQRDMHDLWHTLTQYGRDELGEVCLLAFTYAQTKNRGIGVICLTGCFKLTEYYGKGVFRAAWRAYQDGKRAAWLPAQDWEYLLTQPIDQVRRSLHLSEPEQYRDLQGTLATA